jgi:hypothetical protein
VNYRPVLSSERVLQNNKLQLSKRKSQGERKIGRRSQMGAWHQDELVDWLSVVMWLWLWLGHFDFGQLALLVGEVSKIGTINYAHESRGTQIWERLCWRYPAKTEQYRPDFSSERGPHINKPKTVKKKLIKERMGKIGRGCGFDFDQSSLQRGRYKMTNRKLSKENLKEKEKLVVGPRWAPDTKTDCPTDCQL